MTLIDQLATEILEELLGYNENLKVSAPITYDRELNNVKAKLEAAFRERDKHFIDQALKLAQTYHCDKLVGSPPHIVINKVYYERELTGITLTEEKG